MLREGNTGPLDLSSEAHFFCCRVKGFGTISPTSRQGGLAVDAAKWFGNGQACAHFQAWTAAQAARQKQAEEKL
jgi:hypothetical protein